MNIKNIINSMNNRQFTEMPCKIENVRCFVKPGNTSHANWILVLWVNEKDCSVKIGSQYETADIAMDNDVKFFCGPQIKVKNNKT